GQVPEKLFVLADKAAHQLIGQGLLALEVIEKRALGDAGLFNHVVQRCGRHAAIKRQLKRRVDDALSGLCSVLGHSLSIPSGRFSASDHKALQVELPNLTSESACLTAVYTIPTSRYCSG